MNLQRILIATATASLLAACASTPPAAPVVDKPVAPVAPVVQQPAVTDAAAGNAALDPLKDPNSPLAKRSVYFAFDSSAVRDADKPVIDVHSGYLKAHAGQKVLIQGNTDARGSREYNLALGQRRAESVKKSLQVLGVKENQLEAVSLGMEKPRATGSSEADYAENRRADIVYEGQ